MAIEPLSSAMTYQAQTIKQPQQVVKTEADYSVGGRKAGSVLVAGTIIGTIKRNY